MPEFIYKNLDVPGAGNDKNVSNRPDLQNQYAKSKVTILFSSAQKRMPKLRNAFSPDLETELGIKVDIDQLAVKYEAVPKAQRIPINAISEHLNQLLHSAGECPKFARHIADENSHLVDNLLVQLINGDKGAAAETLDELVQKFMVASEFAEIEDKIKSQKEIIKRQERRHNSEVRGTKKMLEEGKNDMIAMTLQGEKQTNAYLALVKSCGPLVEMREKFMGSGKDRAIREEIMDELAGGENTFEVLAVTKSKRRLSIRRVINGKREVFDHKWVDGGLEMVKIEHKIPKSMDEYKQLEIDAKLDMRFKRRNLYLLTKSQEFKDDFYVTQQFLTEKLYDEVHSELDNAKDEDGNDRYRKEAGDFADQVVMKFDSIQKMQPGSAEKTIAGASKFYQDMDEVLKLINSGSSTHNPTTANGMPIAINFGAIKKESPSTAQVLKNICEAYQKQADNLARDCFQMDPKISEFEKGFQEFWSNAQGIMITAQNVVKDLENGGELPTETMMDSIRRDIDHFVHTPSYGKQSDPQLYLYLLGLSNKAKNLPSVQKQMDAYLDLRKNVEGFTESVNFLYNQPGSREGYLGMGKNILSFGAAIGAAVAAGAIFAGTGGTGAAISAFVIVQTAGVLGYAGAEYALGNKAAMEPRNLAYSWGMALLMGGAGAILAKPLGSIIGSRVAVANQKLMRSRFAPLRALGKSGLEKKTGGILSSKTLLGKTGLVKQFIHEFGEESFQEGMEGLGAAVAGDNPILALALNVLACSPAHARAYADNGSFSVNQNITVDISEKSLNIRYNKKSSVLKYLKSIGASSSMINEFKRDGSIVGIKDGFRIQVRKDRSPSGVRRLLTKRSNKGTAQTAGLKWISKDTYIYKGAKAELIRMFKGEYFVEENNSGDLILANTLGEKITVKSTAAVAVKANVDAAITAAKDSVMELTGSIKDNGLREATRDVVSDIWSGTKAGLIGGVQKLEKIYERLKKSGAGEVLAEIKAEIDKRAVRANDVTTVVALLAMAGVTVGTALYKYLRARQRASFEHSDSAIDEIHKTPWLNLTYNLGEIEYYLSRSDHLSTSISSIINGINPKDLPSNEEVALYIAHTSYSTLRCDIKKHNLGISDLVEIVKVVDSKVDLFMLYSKLIPDMNPSKVEQKIIEIQIAVAIAKLDLAARRQTERKSKALNPSNKLYSNNLRELPKGHVRVYHYTKASNLDAIAESGLTPSSHERRGGDYLNHNFDDEAPPNYSRNQSLFFLGNTSIPADNLSNIAVYPTKRNSVLLEVAVDPNDAIVLDADEYNYLMSSGRQISKSELDKYWGSAMTLSEYNKLPLHERLERFQTPEILFRHDKTIPPNMIRAVDGECWENFSSQALP